MKKYQLLLLISFLIPALTIGAVDSQDEQVISWRQDVQPYSPEQNSLLKASPTALQTLSASSISGGLSYLNELRTHAGMTVFAENILLNQSAFNHSYYHILNNTTGHGEVENTPGFTGVSPTDRASFVGYLSSVSENISAGNSDVNDSINQLFSAIYHRFGFLDFTFDEIGLGTSSSTTYAYENSYVYNPGNNDINQLCAGESYTGGGSYYWGVCADLNFRIEMNTYESALDLNKIANPALVVWPYENQSDSLPVFYEESPDPLPDCAVSGYPMSVQFNDYYSGNIVMQSFKLYDTDNIEVTNTRILTQATDPNARFSAYEFALFPLERLDWNSTYRTEFIYTEDNEQKNKTWFFKTRATLYPYYQVASNNQTLQVVSGKPYVIYIPPADCNDTFNGYSYSYSGLSVDSIGFNDMNSLYVQISGAVGNSMTVNLNNNTSFTIIISETDSALSNTSIPTEVKDATIDFGDQFGIWIYDKKNWIALHNVKSEQIKTADLDGNGQSDIIIDFGAAHGLWVYYNNSSWKQIHSTTSKMFTTGDTDGNGQDDVIVDFGSQYGLWLYKNNSTWIRLNTFSAEILLTSDMDNNNQDEIIIDFGNVHGVWIYHNISGWMQLHNASPVHLSNADMDNNGLDELIIDFGAQYGIWIYQNNNSWIKLHSATSAQIVSGDLDGNGQDDIIIDFGPGFGLWSYMNNSIWVQLHAASPEQMVIRYLDDNYQADLLIDFGTQYGLWAWKNNTSWEQLHTVSPTLIGD